MSSLHSSRQGQDRSYYQYRDALQEIFNNFKMKGDRQDVVNLKEIESYMQKMRNEKKDLGCDIFQMKIKRLPENKKLMSESDFHKYFGQDVTKRSHFDDLFAAIDTDGTDYISKKQLKQMIRKYNLGDFTQRDVASSDGDKVSKQQLAKFLCQYD